MRREAAPCGLIWMDDVVTRRAVRAMMHRRGFAVVEVETVSAALAGAERGADVIVVDLALTGALGLGVVTQLLAAAPGCSIFAVSSFPELNLAALDAGASRLVNEEDLRDLDRCLVGAAPGEDSA